VDSPTAKYTLLAKAPPVRMIDAVGPVSKLDPIWKNQVSVLEPLSVSVPSNVAIVGIS
jgi:hypothetical protein